MANIVHNSIIIVIRDTRQMCLKHTVNKDISVPKPT